MSGRRSNRVGAVNAIEQRVIALAGVFQAAAEVRRIGREGNAGTAALEATVGSLFEFDAASVEHVFGGLTGLPTGIPALQNFLARRSDRAAVEITRYAGSLLRLERKANASPEVLARIRNDLDDMVDRGLSKAPGDPEALQHLAEVYVRHISPLGPRIMVQGEPAYLNASGNPERIRALLLGGIRAAVLWRQVGGRRLNLLLGRRALASGAAAVLARQDAEPVIRPIE